MLLQVWAPRTGLEAVSDEDSVVVGLAVGVHDAFVLHLVAVRDVGGPVLDGLLCGGVEVGLQHRRQRRVRDVEVRAWLEHDLVRKQGAVAKVVNHVLELVGRHGAAREVQ